MEGWRKLTTVEGEAQARIVASFLEGENISVQLKSHVPPSVWPVSVDGLAEVQIWVREDDLPRALEALEALHIRPSWEEAQEELLHELENLGIDDPAVLRALRAVPRHLFVPPHLLPHAYADTPLPIGEGQTVSQPYIVALSTQALELGPDDRVLEVGTGSGYQTAVLAELAKEVFTVERLAALSEEAQNRLASLGYRNVRFKVGDGTKGWPEEAPFEAILVTAGAPFLPPSLLAQLKEGGRMVIPVGDRTRQDLLLVRKVGGKVEERSLCPCTFVPLIGEEGWRD